MSILHIRQVLLRASIAGELAQWHDQVDIVIAQPRSPAVATALLLRPDCYVAWASASPRPDPADLDALRTATQRWFGAAEPARNGSGNLRTT
ncbi:aromatic-ring hydroxylase C-terminal domain-containing protein [Streptomyces sp. NBC_01717]|uniref:aromatic-ring hydroxylase C-terminal domain-containing protein n=1 Tax=Streptomyces sp. NBC_01717 TaxID=2975918 RepID=UPI002E33538F|nr:hypothetical protein [Streptomyces sp. NBC_01717]